MHTCPRCENVILAGAGVVISRTESGDRVYSHRGECPTVGPVAEGEVQPSHEAFECLSPGRCLACRAKGVRRIPERDPTPPSVPTPPPLPEPGTALEVEDRCDHEMLPGQCSYCKPPPHGLPQQVWTTQGGQTFHAVASCPALRDGQAYAERLGMQVHPVRRESIFEAISSRGQCTACFSAQDLANYAAWQRRRKP